MGGAEDADLRFMMATNRSIIALAERIKEAEIEIKFLDGFTDLVLSKQKNTDKVLFRFIIHLAKNGEIRTLIEALSDTQKAKPFTIAVAFDGDEAGQIAQNRFAVEQLCGNPKKFQIGANLAEGIRHINEDLQEHFQYHTDKKTYKYNKYIP